MDLWSYLRRYSREFVEYVKNCRVQKNEIFVSFDVVSLFTSVPVDKAFDLVLELLSSDDALPSRTSLSISDIKQGLKICLDSTIFSYKDFFTSKLLVFPWVLASPLSSLTYTWNISSTLPLLLFTLHLLCS